MSIKTVECDALDFMTQDNNRSVVTADLAVGEALHLGIQRCVQGNPGRHKYIDTDMDTAVAVTLEQFGIGIHGALFQITTDRGYRAGIGDFLQNRGIQLLLVQPRPGAIGSG